MNNKFFLLILLCLFYATLLLLTSCAKKEKTKISLHEEANYHLGNYYCPLCDKKISKKLYQRRPIACIIDNIVYARPQAGLNSACIIYEAPVEGKITRLMAIYLHNDANPIGPIRSARSYFIDWALEYDAVFVHCGQSWDAFDKIYRLNFPTINEMWQKGAFFRTKYRRSPYNLFTSSYKLREVIEQKRWQKYLTESHFFFSDISEAAEKLNATSIEIVYSKNYKVSYHYDEIENSYTRLINNRPHIDCDDNKAIKVKNIVLQFVESIPIDEEDRKEIITIGEGKAIVINSGRKIAGAWFKKDIESETVYFDEEDNIVTFLPGKTFIQIVPMDTEVKIADSKNSN